MTANVQTLTLGGQRSVVLPEADYRELVGETWEPPLPQPDAKGNYPAVEAARVLLARKLIRRRRAAGLTQAELARRAGVRVCGWKPSAGWNTPSTAPTWRPSIRSSARWSRPRALGRPVGRRPRQPAAKAQNAPQGSEAPPGATAGLPSSVRRPREAPYPLAANLQDQTRRLRHGRHCRASRAPCAA